MFFGVDVMTKCCLILNNADGCIAQAVSADLKLPWGARSRGGTGEEKQVRCVSHGSDCLGYGCQGVSIRSKLFFGVLII